MNLDKVQTDFFKYLFSLDTPMAKLYQQLHKDSHVFGDTDKTINYIVNWKKANSELATELRDYLGQAETDFKEMYNDKA